MSRKSRILLVILAIGAAAVVALFAYMSTGTTSEEEDLQTAQRRLEPVRWEGMRSDVSADCPQGSSCFVTDVEPPRAAADQAVTLLRRAGFDVQDVSCDPDLSDACRVHVAAGKAVVAVAVTPQAPAAEGSYVIVSEPFVP